MDDLFEQFIKERRYLRNLAESTLDYYRQTYTFFKQVGAFAPLTKQSLQFALIAFRERGTSVGAINTYIRGLNTFLNWLHDEQNYENFSLKLLKGNKPIFRSLTDKELKYIIRYKPKYFTGKRL
jgi:site-specific recombinase XerD